MRVRAEDLMQLCYTVSLLCFNDVWIFSMGNAIHKCLYKREKDSQIHTVEVRSLFIVALAA